MKPVVVIGFLGSTLDQGKNAGALGALAADRRRCASIRN